MSRTDTHSLIDRLFLAHRALQAAHRPIRASVLQAELGHCSRKQLQKTIAHLRDVLHAPLVYDPQSHGWHYDRRLPAFELPGLWFTATELHALLAAEQMLAQAEPGALHEAILPLRQRIAELLRKGSPQRPLRADAVRFTTPMLRRGDRHIFALVAEATLTGRQIHVHYRPRSNARAGRRLLSPWRLEHYRGNWYLQAWCHQRQDWRRFALERISQASLDDTPAIWPSEAPDSSAFGLFDRKASATAVLHFNAERARWIAEEIWHPDQQGRRLPDGSYELRLPYGDPTELILDILRYGPDVEVLAPARLRLQVQQRLQQALARYQQATA